MTRENYPNSERIDVLVVEDDEISRISLCETLAIEGYSFRWAQDGKVALAWLANYEFKLVVSDLFMPNCDGLELLMKAKPMYPRTKFLMYSGVSPTSALSSSLEVAICFGCETMRKPFGSDEFVRTVSRLIGDASRLCRRS